jgi:lysophospholipid acyltransferase (LPLAT)-like uncharacterized protein
MMPEVSSASENPAAKPKRRKSGVVVPHAPAWHQRLVAWLVFLSIRALTMTFRYRWDKSIEVLESPPAGPLIFCTWHNRLLLSMEAYRFFKKTTPRKGMAAMVSASRDGGLLAAILERFKVQPVRGSSSRRGPQALLELTTWGERGYDLAITPDGPRGPSGIVQEGVLSLAQVTGYPIVPFSFHARRKIRFKSWDRFQVPLPFARCDMKAGAAVSVPRGLTDAEREAVRKKLEQTLREISVD